MELLQTIDHKLNLDSVIESVEKYCQFSECFLKNNSTDNSVENNEIERLDILETILYQLDPQFNLLCMSRNKHEITKYTMNIRSELMNGFITNKHIKKYNTRAGMSKVNISYSLSNTDTNQAGLIYYSDILNINIVLIDRNKKSFHHIRPPNPEYHYLMINIVNEDDKEKYQSPQILDNYLFKEQDLQSYILDYTEVKRISDISVMKECVKNLNNVYKKETNGKKITDYKVGDLQGLAVSNNISIFQESGKKKTKAQLFEELVNFL